jgi:hypothetical protein
MGAGRGLPSVMPMTSLIGTAAELVRSGKGILAADESVSTMTTPWPLSRPACTCASPGTGKTTVALRMAELLHRLAAAGSLGKDDLMRLEPADFLASRVFTG